MAVGSLGVAACAEEQPLVDPSGTVAIELQGVWTDDERQAADNAASAWNLEFGTRVRLAEFGDEAPLPIWFTDDACKNERNQQTHARATTDPPAIRVCPKTAEDLTLLFETLRHELGHILGIPVHASDPSAVMTGRATNLVHWFRDEDRDLFFGANKTFSGETGCAVSPLIADGDPMLAHPADFPLHLVWAKAETIRFAPLSKTGVLGAEAGRITTETAPSRIDAHSTKDGFVVTWFEENKINLTTVGLPDGLASETHGIELEWPLSSFYRVSDRHAAPYYWLALTIREDTTNTPRTLHLFQLDESSGAVIGTRAFPMADGEIVIHQDQPFLITGEIDLATAETRVRLHRIEARADGFDLTESIDVATVPFDVVDGWARPEPILAAQATSRGVVMLLETSVENAIDLVRATTDGSLAVEQSVAVHVGPVRDPAILEGHDHLFIAASMPAPTHYVNELYVAQLAPDTLEIEQPWTRLSAADTVPAEEARLAISSENLVAVWKEPSGDVRSRCLRLE